ncbi:hypothetical protein ACHAXM_005869 [Skeletonema potamos]
MAERLSIQQKEATQMKHIIERRDFLTLLLTNSHPAATSKDSNVAHLPAGELKSLLVAISTECSGKTSVLSLGSFRDVQEEEVVYERPRKRARRSINNNHHSILRFVERILENRYANNDRSAVNDNKHARFLQSEIRSYFGTNDASFRAEEDILCLAFELAYDAIRSVACSDNSDDISPSQLKSIPDIIRQRDIVDTSLRIIDLVIHVDTQERRTRDRLRQSRMKRSSLSNQYTITNKRQKYAHLLQTNVKERSKQSATYVLEGEPLVVEKRNPKEWEWLVEFRSKYSSITDSHLHTETIQLNVYCKSNDDGGPSQLENHAKSKSQLLQEFVILRRKYDSMDDISLSSSETHQEMEDDNENEVADSDSLLLRQKTGINTAPTTEETTRDTGAALENSVVDNEASSSPIDELDKESRELRTTLIDLPPGELSSAQIINHATDTLVTLLNRYSDLSGTAGIHHCGDIIRGNSCDSNANVKFPLNEEIVTSLINSYLTNATGALRAKALMNSFVLPLVQEMNPVATTTDTKQQKPASRSLTSLIVTLARERPMECVDAILAPAILPPSTHATDNWEPSRFQCELISRVLRAGRDSLSLQAIAQLVEKMLPIDTGSTGVKWTDNSMPLLTTCLNRRPSLSDVVIRRMADEIIDVLSPNKCESIEKNMKFATLFNTLVSKYGPQLKTANKVDPLIEAVSRLKTFMSKTVTASLKKLK